MQTLWKQDVTLHPDFIKINQCLDEDWFLLPFELRQQRAHARALRQADILTESEYRVVIDGLAGIESEFSDKPCPISEVEDLHTWVELMLTQLIGEAGKKIHTARSRNDQVATVIKLYVVSSGRRLLEDLQNLVRVCCERALEWSELVFPLHTHTQFAAPGSVGSWLLKYACAFDRLRRQLMFYLSQWREYCPLGSGAVAGSSIAVDRQVQAEELDFEKPSLSALDSTSTRDECLELLALAAHTALHLQSLASDVILFSQTPLNWTIYPPSFGTGSSMMPNKVNPDAMELLRGECSAVSAAHNQAILLMKGLPSGYNRDLQCIKPVVASAVEKLHPLCRMTVSFLKQLEFDTKQLEASLKQGGIDATMKMEQKVAAGTPLREAHLAVAAELAGTAGGKADQDLIDLNLYQTAGSANPKETLRVAKTLLNGLDQAS